MPSLNINYDSAISDYKTAIDSLIQGVGQVHLLIFADTVTQTNDNYFDTIRDDINLKPAFKSQAGDLAPNVVRNAYLFQGLIKWQPEDFDKQDNSRISVPQADLRIKSSIEATNSIQSCKYIIPNVTIAPINQNFLNIPIYQPQGNVPTSGTNYFLWNDTNGNPFCYISQLVDTKFQLCKPVQPRGLGSSIYIYSFWQQVS